jgi:hypothetical protein
MPERMLMDNGGPWGKSQEHPYTSFTAWLIRLGVNVIHSSPYHPQSIGKDERFHRTVQAEVLGGRIFQDLDHCQQHFDAWREVYNLERPHQALEMAVPASRYKESKQAFPEALMPIEYGPDDIVRKVDEKGKISYLGRRFRISKAFYGYPVALRPTCDDGILNVFFCHQKVKRIDMGNNYPERRKC